MRSRETARDTELGENQVLEQPPEEGPPGKQAPAAWRAHRAEAAELDGRIHALQAELAMERARAQKQRQALAGAQLNDTQP